MLAPYLPGWWMAAFATAYLVGAGAAISALILWSARRPGRRDGRPVESDVAGTGPGFQIPAVAPGDTLPPCIRRGT